MDFYHLLNAFNDVVTSHFSSHYEAEFAENKMMVFRKSYEQLCQKSTLTCTPKVHAVLHHVPDFCKMMKRGLGTYNEQAFEAVHADFKSTWLRFKRSSNNPSYGAKLLRAICVYNAGHVIPDSK